MSLSLQLGLAYFISELLLTVTRRSRSRTGTKQDRSTLGVLWLVIMVSIIAGIYVAMNWRAATLPYGQTLAVVGVILFVAGLVLRWWAIITLGRFFTVDVTIEKDHELVERGPFRLVRHPSYTGVLLAFVGFALTLGNWAALLVMLVPIFAAFIRRMNVEEEALSRALGGRYADYMGRTKRLVPFVYETPRHAMTGVFTGSSTSSRNLTQKKICGNLRNLWIESRYASHSEALKATDHEHEQEHEND